MRPIPDDVQPVPKTAPLGALVVPAAPAGDAGARVAEGPRGQKPPPCADARGRALEVRRIAPDRWLIASGVLDVVRNERKVVLSPRTDAAGRLVGFTVQDLGDRSCFGALGFATGDVLRSVNSLPLDADGLESAALYQSIIKNGAAVVRFDRGGQPTTVVYEILGG